MTVSKDTLEESIIFELFILETATSNNYPYNFDSVDLRSPDNIPTITSSIAVSVSAQDVNALIGSFIPLTFGAAWKIVDLIIEFALDQDSERAKKQRWTIEEKKRLAMVGISNQILPGCNDLTWQAILSSYGATTEHRHCLVHRRANIDHTSGDLNGADKNHQPLTTLTKNDQTSFARAVLIFSNCLLAGRMSLRENENILYHLNHLSNHTRIPIHGTSHPHQVEIKMSLLVRDGTYELDVKTALEIAQQRFPTVRYFNLLIDIPGDLERKLVAAAEDCPSDNMIVELNALPPWIRFKL